MLPCPTHISILPLTLEGHKPVPRHLDLNLIAVTLKQLLSLSSNTLMTALSHFTLKSLILHTFPLKNNKNIFNKNIKMFTKKTFDSNLNQERETVGTPFHPPH